MIFELDEETLDFVCKKKISFNQFFMCLLINKKDVTNIIRVTNEIGEMGACMIPRGVNKQGEQQYIQEIEDLIKRGFLIHAMYDKKDPYALDNFVVTDKFTEGFIVDKQSLFKELWDNYPDKLMVQGGTYPAKTSDYEELEVKYLKAINNSIKKHKEIVNKIKAFKETSGYAIMGIEKFVTSRQWEGLEENIKAKSRGI